MFYFYAVLSHLVRVITEVVHALFYFFFFFFQELEYVPEEDHRLIRNTLKCHSINYQYSRQHCFSSTYKTIIKQMLGI